MNYQIIAMQPSDWKQVCEIYAQGIQTGQATFETKVPSWEQWDENHLKICRIVACSGESILGWAVLSPTSKRFAYAGVVEVSIYVDKKYCGQGVGKALLERLISLSEEVGFWTLQSTIIRENIASYRLHEKCGFRKVGVREKIAKIGNEWHDTVLMEWRSKHIQ
ncbi:phosphinothricin acetyltransferase [Sporomusaceae bacterium BoRhaA]|uniref:GNAT family N-acetyltransferase n=1 Tax=Pelorhabdus rhamnosifermentans TaxID=2772457 RepID=UPI001C05F689|nr:GNAT family N-acetyltransferase [Pelorhabdus rhamnosifermentans]MBU2701391.1 phosphinothricin acetyltransferase [Pelorhabdus rhamnosifermentans]